ncbi:MAG: AbrB/MazE/SpoVT family DNA-binding domain-containing protein [Proteobacteria bacterium]|nr:AbrB/MazE/SpoVT family DNA-binding domain-containing protein [Pseudomonadota bacterium]
MDTTRLSSKGQVVLPSAVRASRKWAPGTRFEVVETAEGVLLRPLKPVPPTSVDEVFGMARYRGPKRSLADMDAAVRTEARRRRR